MAYDPMEGFQIGQAIGKSKRSAFGGTAEHLNEITKERDKNSLKTSPLELMMLKQAMPQPETGVYSWNPTSKKLEREAGVPKGSIVRNTTTAEDMATKYSVRNQFESPTEGEVKTGVNAEETMSLARKLRDTLMDPEEFSGTKIKAALPWGVFDKKAQDFKLTRADLSDRILRLRSGAQINEQEFKRLSQLLPSAMRYDEIDIQKLTDFENEFSKVADRINKGYIWDGKQFSLPGGNVLQQSASNQQNGSSSQDRGTIMEDAQGNRARVFQDGRIEEL